MGREDIRVFIVGDESGFVRSLERASTASKSFSATLQAAGARMQSVGKTITRDVTLPLVGASIAAVKTFSDFQSTMLQLQTQAGASAGEVKKMSAAVLDLAKSTEQGPTQLAQALFELESRGVRGAKALDALKEAAKGAAVGGANLTDVTKALGSAVVTGIKGVQDYNQAMGTVNATVGAGAMHMQDLADAFGTGILPTAKAVGLSLSEVGAALAVMTDRGTPADEAATRLKMTLSMMEAPSKAAQKALGDMGISQGELATAMRGPGGFGAALQILKDQMAKLGDGTRATQDLMHAFGGGKSGAAIVTLVESLTSHLSDYNGKLDQIRQTSGKFNQEVVAESQTAHHQLMLAWSSVQVALVKFGAVMAPVAVKIAGGVTKIIDAFDRLPHSVKTAVGIALAALAVGGPLMLALGKVTLAVGAIADGFSGLGSAASVGVKGAVGALGALDAALGSTALAAGTVGVALAGLAAAGYGAYRLGEWINTKVHPAAVPGAGPGTLNPDVNGMSMIPSGPPKFPGQTTLPGALMSHIPSVPNIGTAYANTPEGPNITPFGLTTGATTAYRQATAAAASALAASKKAAAAAEASSAVPIGSGSSSGASKAAAAAKKAAAALERARKAAFAKLVAETPSVPSEYVGGVLMPIAQVKAQEKAGAELAKEWAKEAADQAKALKAQQAALAKHLADLNRAVTANRTAFDSAWSTMGQQATAAFDKATQQGLQKMQRDAQAQLTAFDAETRAHLQSIQQQYAAPTASEAALAALQDTHDEAARQTAIQAAQASGDQQALADALYAEQVAQLQKQATAERDAANQKSQQAQADYQQQRDAARTALDQQLQDAQQAYSDQRDAQKAALEQQEKDLETSLANRVTGYQDTFAQILALYQQFGLDMSAVQIPLPGGGSVQDPFSSATDAAAAAANALGKSQDQAIGAQVGAKAAPPAGYAPAGSIALARQLGAFASGGSFLTTGPSVFLAGERGPERVDVTPIGAHAPIDAGAGTRPIVIQLMLEGNTLLASDHATGRAIADAIEPHIQKIVSMRRT